MFSLPYLAAIFLSIFQISTSISPFPIFVDDVDYSPAPKPSPGSPDQGTVPVTCLKRNHTPEYVPQYVVIPQYNPTSGSIFANAPCVTIYTNTLLEAIYSSNILREVFDLSQTPAQNYVDFLTDKGRKYLLSLGVENVDELLEFSFRGVRQYFEVLTLPIVARYYANSAANFLFTDSFLQINNAEYLAAEYARVMTTRAKISLNSDPSSKFQVLGDSFRIYFESLGLATKEKYPFIVYYVGNEWFVAAINYRWS